MASLLRLPFPPMEALSVDEVPLGPQWQYEPKWDGFRCLVFRDGESISLQSKSGKPLTRYFPEMVEALRALPQSSFVLDGELVVPEGKLFSFDALLQRIHPAESRIQKLALETPALLIVFDLLADSDRELITEFLPVRRKRLEAFDKTKFREHRLHPTITLHN
jgi:ATP-dependent DNA ligase